MTTPSLAIEAFTKFFPSLKNFVEDGETDSEALKPETLKQNHPEAFLEYSILMGFDPSVLTEEEYNSQQFFKYRLYHNRIIKYANSNALNDPSVFISDEYLLAKAVKDIPLDAISSAKLLQLKYLTANNKVDRTNAFDKYKELFPDADSQEVRAYLKVLLAHRTNKLNELESSIKVSKDCKYLAAWKRCREYLKVILEKPVVTLNEFIDTLPTMKVVENPVFNYDEKDPMFNLNILIGALPYNKISDKEEILQRVNNYMDNKDIVKMLPQYKNYWHDGRLVFEIGEDEEDFFKNYKGVLNTKYFVITVNPVDMLFCSTDQEYQSCYSLLSDYGSTPGLPNFIAQPHTAMCFLSSGSMSKPWRHDRFPGLAFKHIKIKARAFLFTSEDKKHIGVGRSYAPNEIRDASRMHVGTDWDFRNQAQLFFFKLLKDAEKSSDLTYLLSHGLTKKYIFNMKKNPEYLQRIFNNNGDYVFKTTPYSFRPLESNASETEVYLDNLKVYNRGQSTVSPEVQDVFTYTIGQGSCSRYVCSSTLSSRYKLGLEQIKRKKESEEAC